MGMCLGNFAHCCKLSSSLVSTVILHTFWELPYIQSTTILHGYITCYLGNTTLEERYQHMLPRVTGFVIRCLLQVNSIMFTFNA